MRSKIFTDLGKIIERDSKSATYKFALLRGTIEIILENSPYIITEKENKQVRIPTWLLVEKWLLYYFPVFDAGQFIPQLNGESEDENSKKVRFRRPFMPIINYYRQNGGYSAFFGDLRVKSIPNDLERIFIQLADSVYETITIQPMRYLGGSISSEHYSVFKYEKKRKRNVNKPINTISMLERYGDFFLPGEYYDLFTLMGPFILGSGSLLQKWAEFTVSAARGSEDIKVNDVLNILTISPVEEREVHLSQRIFQSFFTLNGLLTCVWSGKKIRNREEFHLDHLIPFSIWKNNDLWNLLPATNIINQRKRDKIPGLDLLHARKPQLIQYWSFLEKEQPDIFSREVKHSLLGRNWEGSWEEACFNALMRSCDHLINSRGYEPWNG